MLRREDQSEQGSAPKENTKVDTVVTHDIINNIFLW